MNYLSRGWLVCAGLLIGLSGGGTAARAEDNQIAPVVIINPSFDEDMDMAGVPLGWKRYGGGGIDQTLRLQEVDGGRALIISDPDPGAEIGVYQDFPARGGVSYRVRVKVRRVGDAVSTGANLQLRFFPSEEYKQVSLAAESGDAFNEIVLYGTAPEGTTSARLYLYTHKEPTPKVMVDDVRIEAGVTPPAVAPSGPAQVPPPIPPQFDRLKELHLTTELVAGGQARISIVTPATGSYDAEAKLIQDAIRQATGVAVPIVNDDAPAAALPLTGNLICLGNRSTNATIAGLYAQFYTLLDLKYPGPGGYEVRTLHDPFGNGYNVIFAGGSDAEGVAAAARVLAEKLRAQGRRGELSVGWMAEIKLGRGLQVPTELKDFKIWEESAMYGSSGYFGWNMISKRMAMYYMTGDESQLDEFLRLAFPDAAAIKDIEDYDGERIENKHDPLAGPYHYAAHMMILFWDLIEESPYFTDEQRLKITNAFSRQLTHRAKEGAYGRTSPPGSVGDRHGDWSATSLYVLARYFDKYYPDPIWTCALRSVDTYYSALERSPWLASMNDHLFWYTSYYDPMIDYFIMSGKRPGFANGNFAQALKTQDILFTGSISDWGLKASSLNFLLRAADLTGDGRFLYYLQRTSLDTDVFRLGQSWWPDQSLQPRAPTELLDTWTIQPMPEPMWAARGKPLPLENQFLWGSYRNTLDQTGDYLLIKGHNGGGRNPYHTFVPLELRIAGVTLLKDYGTQVLTSADGMVEPIVAMDSQLLHHDVLGQTVSATGDVPRAAYCDWKRDLVLCPGRWCLFVDDLGFRTDSENVSVETQWQAVGGSWVAAEQKLSIKGAGEAPRPDDGWLRFAALRSSYTCGPGSAQELLSRLESINTLLLKATAPGTWVQMSFDLAQPVRGEVFADLLNYSDRGLVRLWLDGEAAVEQYDHQAQSAIPAQVSLGPRELAAGPHTLRLEITGKQPNSERMYGGLMGVSIRPEGVPEAGQPLQFELHPSDPQEITSGGVVKMLWRGPVTKGQHRIHFYLLGSRGRDERLACAKLADNAAALALPDPGLAVVGEYADLAGELVVLSSEHAWGRAVTKLGGLLESSAPLDLDWDLTGGALHVATTAEAQVQIAGAAQPRTLAAGRHELQATPPLDTLAALRERLVAWGEQARSERQRLLAAAQTAPAQQLPALTEVAAGTILGKPLASLTLRGAEGEVVALAEGNTIHLLRPDATELRALRTDGEIKCLAWWPEHRLLLAGCKDEKVIAFDESGARAWEFTSVMDRAVWEEGKQYWFKQALPGVHGLHTGVFLNGESQCFVGSACTVEILDAQGRLLHRLPVFWGAAWKFLLVDGPDRTVNLLVSMWPNGNDDVAIISNDGPRQVGRGYYGVPEGHTMVGGWTALNRTALQYVDVDEDGTREVVSGINGVYNRVTVFSAAGKPLYNAQFGPGSKEAYANLRDLAVADLDGDGDMEILVATVSGLVVCLDHQCQKVWSERTPSPPSQLEVVGNGIYAGCDRGEVVRITPAGETTALSKMKGRVVRMETLGDRIMVATDQGEVRAFALQ